MREDISGVNKILAKTIFALCATLYVSQLRWVLFCILWDMKVIHYHGHVQKMTGDIWKLRLSENRRKKFCFDCKGWMYSSRKNNCEC